MPFTLDEFSLAGMVAIVTGAGGRGNSIGRAYALGLAHVGASIVIADLNAEGAERVAAEIREMGGRCVAVQVDISSQTSVAAMAASAIENFGGIDILVNNAAMMAELNFLPASIIPIDEWNKILSVNLTGALNCVQAVLPCMISRGGGKIINAVSSGAFPATSVYGISKLALVGLTTTLARELGPKNINVNAIAPGNTLSDAGKSLAPLSPKSDSAYTAVAMRPEGEPDELVGALLLLASPAGAWITGQILNIDGGRVMRQ